MFQVHDLVDLSVTESLTVSKRTKFGRRIWPIQEFETATQT